jgi:hypothetical protein
LAETHVYHNNLSDDQSDSEFQYNEVTAEETAEMTADMTAEVTAEMTADSTAVMAAEVRNAYLLEEATEAAEQHDHDNGSTSDSYTEEDVIHDIMDEPINVQLSSDSESDTDGDETVAEKLASWATNHSIKHSALDDLLKLLQPHVKSALPVTARTLLKTVECVQTITKSGMEYVYLGLKENILTALQRSSLNIQEDVTSLNLSFNIDGLPIFKSNNMSLWPVLCALKLERTIVFPIALAYGHSKPSDLDFLDDSVQEIKMLLTEGIEFENKNIQVKVHSIVCDAPAKAIVKGVKLYSGYYGCDKCDQRGVWLKRITYQEVDNLHLRSDHEFRMQTQDEHHHKVSPFTDLPIDMIKEFPVDYMHQVCLGVMKRLLLVWIRGPRENKMSAQQIIEVSERLICLRKCIPSVFARKPRSLAEVDYWKATEFRQLLLYTGKFVLKGVLRDDLYDNFMVLSVAMSILVSPTLAQSYIEYASDLLTYFVKQARSLYGPTFLVYNVHSLLHIVEDVKHLGVVDEFSAFPFENHLHKIKKLVRSGKKPLVQIVKRLSEIENTDPIVYKPCRNTISTTRPNNIYLIDGSCCEVVELSSDNEYLCRVFSEVKPAFDKPCDSTLLGIYKAGTRHTFMKRVHKDSIRQQAVMMEHDGAFVFVAILNQF